jgi:hypothetical protein
VKFVEATRKYHKEMVPFLKGTWLEGMVFKAHFLFMIQMLHVF